MQLRKATRQKSKLRIGLSAASGFGKTYSALLLASGITDWDKIAVIDTEHGSAELYSDLGDYNVLSLEPPFSPERYIEAIKACEAGGMEVIIIDSISHEWEGKGGCLEIQESLGGRYQDWAKVTPRHQKFIDAILQSSCHVLTTVRRKQDYNMIQDGKSTKVEKAGMKEVTREGFEYELTLNFEIVNDRHLVRASKDRTGLYSGKPEFMITAETGKQLKDWAESGKTAAEMEQERQNTLLLEIDNCTDVACTKALYSKHPQLQKEDWFKGAIIKKGNSLLEAESSPATEPEPEATQTDTPELFVQPAAGTQAKTPDLEALRLEATKLNNHERFDRIEKRNFLTKMPKLNDQELRLEIERMKQTIENRSEEPAPQITYRNENEVA